MRPQEIGFGDIFQGGVRAFSTFSSPQTTIAHSVEVFCRGETQETELRKLDMLSFLKA
jgi:hypothetical protein